MKGARCIRRYGAHLDHDASLACACQYSFCTLIDAQNRFVVWQARHDHLRSHCELANARGRHRSLSAERCHLMTRVVVRDELEAVIEEPARQALSHSSKPY